MTFELMERKVILALDMMIGKSIVPFSKTVCSDKNVLYQHCPLW